MTDTTYISDLQAFMAEQTARRRVIAYDPIFADMAGDVLAGLVLSQICYWHSADKKGQTRMRVAKDGRLWAALSAKQMHEDLRMSSAQIMRCYGILEKKNLILKHVWRFAGAPTTHISLNWPVFKEARQRCIAALVEKIEFAQDETDTEDAQLPAVEDDLSVEAIGFEPERKSDLSQSANHYIDFSESSSKTSEIPSTESHVAPSSAVPKEHQNAVRKAVVEHFQEKTNLHPPTNGGAKGVAKLWWAPIREICGLVEFDERRAIALVDAALLQLKSLTVSDPNSILKTARAIAAQQVVSRPVKRGGAVIIPNRGTG